MLKGWYKVGSLTGGHAVVQVLDREGVEKVFCVPGESYLDVLDGLYQHERIELIANRHESGTSFMAEAYAKASGKVGVCLATRGPGASNLTIGLHTAAQDSTPLVALIGQVERDTEFREGFQEVDFVSMYQSMCKWVVEIKHANRVPELLHRAFHLARSGRPGPVVVVLSHDMLTDSLPDDWLTDNRFRPFPRPRLRAEGSDVEAIFEELRLAKRPIVIAGGGLLRADATQELMAFADKFHLPVATAFRRYDAFPNRDVHYAGGLGFGPAKYLASYISEADVVIAIGTRLSQVTTRDYTLLQPDTKLIHVDISPDVIGKSYHPTIPVVADAQVFLHDLLTIAEDYKVPVRPDVEKLHQQYIEFSTPVKDYAENFVDMDGLMHDFVLHAPEDVVLTSDAGNFFSWLSRYYRFDRPGTYFGPTSGAMGYGLPAAIGVKLAQPDKTVISFSGDGGFMMTMQELNTAVRYNIPVIAIVINNGLYGTIRAHQERHYPGRVVGTELTNPDFSEVATLFGCHGEKVVRNADFVPALERALKAKRPAVIEVMTNPDILSANHAKESRSVSR
jgi:acetolactate synthase I/II/III large subunit